MHLCMSFVDVLKIKIFSNVRDILVSKKSVNNTFYKFIFHQSFCKFIICDISKRAVYRTKVFDDDFRDFFKLIKIIIFLTTVLMNSSALFFLLYFFIIKKKTVNRKFINNLLFAKTFDTLKI